MVVEVIIIIVLMLDIPIMTPMENHSVLISHMLSLIPVFITNV